MYTSIKSFLDGINDALRRILGTSETLVYPEVSGPVPAPFGRWHGASAALLGEPEFTILAVPGIERWTPQDRAALLDAAQTLRIPVDSLVTVWSSESGLDTRAAYGVRHLKTGEPMKGPDGAYLMSADNERRVREGKKPFYAVGLFQLTLGANLEGFTSNDALLSMLDMTPEEQIAIGVRLYTKYGKGAQNASPGKLYMYNFLPEHAGKDESYVLGEQGSSRYDMNRGFDTSGNQDGKLTVGEVYNTVARAAKRAKGRRITVRGTILEPDGSSSPVPPTAARSEPTVAAPPASASPARGMRPWERFGPVVYDLVTITVNGIPVEVTRVPANVVASGVLVYPPFSLLDALEYGEGNGLFPLTAAMFDAMHLQGWFHEPIVGWYDVGKSMNTDSLVLELGRRWSLALKNGNYAPSMGAVPNIGKAWIASAKGVANPGKAVNRGFYFEQGKVGTARSPVQKEGVAHPATYKDLAQPFWACRVPGYVDACSRGAFGDAPFSWAEFVKAAKT